MNIVNASFWNFHCEKFVLCINYWMQTLGQKLATIQLFSDLRHSKTWINIKIGGRSIVLYMELIFCHPHRFLLLGMDSFITSLSICPPPKKRIWIKIGDFMACICMDLITIMANLLGKWKKWVQSKHMCYILQHVMYCK